jgi:hypothetical protein
VSKSCNLSMSLAATSVDQAYTNILEILFDYTKGIQRLCERIQTLITLEPDKIFN